MKSNKVLSKILPVIFIGSSLCFTSLSGCSILPTEEVRCVLPTVAAQDIPEYDLVSVIRTDIIKTSTINCIYSGSSDKIDLFFNTSGLYVKDVYVEKGDQVSKGDLLAALDTGDLTERIEALVQGIAEHKLELSQLKELKELEEIKINTQYKNGLIAADQYDSEIANLEKTYAQLSILEDTIYYEELEYETLCAQQENAYIYSPVDGIITSVSDDLFDPYLASSEYESVISVVEYANLGFKAFTAYRDHFNEGDTITISLDQDTGKEYEVTIAFNHSDSQEMYLFPTEEIQDLEYGARASFSIVLEHRDDVLAVDSDAIRTGKDSQYVYYIDENDYRNIKFVTTGLEDDNGYIEVLSGLELGEIVIK